MHIICIAKRLGAVQELTINALVDNAIKSIPASLGTSVAGDIQLQNSADAREALAVDGPDGEKPAGDEDGPEEFEMARDADETNVGET